MAKTRKIKANKLSKNVSRAKRGGKIWVMSVDPFNETAIGPLWQLVQPLAEKAGAQVQAAYVLAPSSFNWTGEFSGPWMKKYIPIAVEKLTSVLPAEIKKKVIPSSEAGQRSAVKALIKHAESMRADCIVISTHGRQGLERVALGSFAETLILTSKIPVMALNPACKVPNQVRKILVPTDLTKRSEKFVMALADYAKELNAEIVLYHKQPDPLDPIIQQGVYSLGGGWVSVQNFIDEELEQKNKQFARLESEIRKRNVSVSHVLDSSPGGLIESIEKAAKDNGADMISVLTQSGSWGAALLGSVARGLVRTSPVPVLVKR